MKGFSFGLATLATLIVVGCGKTSPAETPVSEPTASATDTVQLDREAIITAEIRSEPAAVRPLNSFLEVSGTVALPTDSHAIASPPVSGRIVRLFASFGDEVRKGQPLVEIQSSELAQVSSDIVAAEARESQATADVRQKVSAADLARGRLRNALSSLCRQRRFARAGAFSQPSLLVARGELSEAQTEESAAQSALAAAESKFDRTERLSKEGLVSRVEFDQAKLEVQLAKIQIERASQRLSLAHQTLRREVRIEQQGLLNAREIQTAEAEVRAAKLEADQALVALEGAKSAAQGMRRMVKNARSNLTALRGGGVGGASTLTLTAPISGTVVQREATIGQAVERSSELYDIDDDTVMWVTAIVPEANIAGVRPGASVTITTPSQPGHSFLGTVQILGERLDVKTRTLPVQIRVPNRKALLRAGLSANVRIVLGGNRSGLSVRSTAIVGEGDNVTIFVNDKGKYIRRKVELGRHYGEYVEIVKGLVAGEKVVVSGAFTLDSELKSGGEGE